MAISKAAQEAWTEEHSVFYHRCQEPIKIVNANLFPVSVCYKHSMCLCGQPHILRFYKKFTTCMKLLSKKTKTKITKQRLLLEEARVVFRLTSSGQDLEVGSELYFHPGYINFKTWMLTVMEMKKITEKNEHGFLQLTPSCCQDAGLNGHGVKTFEQFVKDNVDFSLQYTARIFYLVCDDQLLADEYMCGSCVEVVLFDELGEFTVWNGSGHEGLDSPHRLLKKRRVEPKERGTEKKTVQRRAKPVQPPNLAMLGGPPLQNSELPGESGDDDLLNELIRADWADSEHESEHDSFSEGGEEESHFEEDEEFEHIDELFGDSDSVASRDVAKERDKDEVLDEALAAAPSSDTDNGAPDAANESSSSSSTSSSSSSSSSKHEPRRLRINEYTIQVGTHEIHYNVNGEAFRAHCSVHQGCKRQRTARSSQFSFHNKGQGRPLGLLMAWLESADQFPDKQSHMKAHAHDFAQRRPARARFKALPGSKTFLDQEREQGDSEYSEPEDLI